MEMLDGKQVRGYQLRQKLGEGGFGAVYLAHQTSVGRDVAIKIIRPDFANQPDFIRRFETEAQTIARLEHMHIVPLHDYWREPDGAYLVMRYLRGGSLRDSIQKNGPCSSQRAGQILNQVAAALETAHSRQIIHRDIKPENILLDEDGNAYLADFGIAKNLNFKDGVTAAEEIVGSLDYISPEQARSEPVTVRTDVYTLGIVLYEMLTGTHPWPELSSVERLYRHINDPLPIITDIDGVDLDALNAVIQKATAKNPQHRYETPLKLAEAFETDVIGSTISGDELVNQLTMREQEVLQGILDGKSNKEIANDLVIELTTVKWYIRQIYSKLGVRSRVQAIIRARELNLITSGSTAEEDSTPELSPIHTQVLAQVDNPYKGLRAFTSADALDFFGRERLVRRLTQRLANERLLAVVGPSGSGKSSAVRAGVIPAIWRGDIPGSSRWYVVEMLPGARPLDQLEIALTRIASSQSINIGPQLSRDANGLLRCADLILPDDNSELVVVVDQFEEVFTLVEDEEARQHFLDLLAATATDPRSRVRIIITLRADFYDRPLRYPDFGALLRSSMETILPLSAEELERAIVEPARRVGVIFEPGLVSKLVGEMNYQSGALPLLQYALTELFDRREGVQITHAAYNDIGGAVGALARRAELTYQEMSAPQRLATRQMFLRLVTLGDNTEDTRRRTPRPELLDIADDTEMMDDIIDTFASYRLLSLDNDPDTRTPTVEVAHEAILREWERLRTWLDESRADIRLERVLAHNADEWLTHNRDAAYLLRGSRLEQFESWIDVTDVSLTPDERGYVQASLQARSQHQREELERHEREAALERRSRQRMRYLVAVLAILLIMAVGFSIFAVDRENQTLAALARAESAQATSAYNAQQSRHLALVNAARAANASDDQDTAIAMAIAAANMPNAGLAAQAILAESAYDPGTVRTFAAQEPVWHVAVHPIEPLALSSAAFGFERVLWNLQTGDRVQEFSGPSDEDGKGYTISAFNPDGETALFGRIDGVIVIYERSTGSEIARLESEDIRLSVQGMEFINDNELMVAYADFNQAGECTGALVIWDVAASEIVHRFDVPSQCQAGLFVSADGKTAVTGGSINSTIGFDDPGIVSLWDLEKRELITNLGGDMAHHNRFVAAALISPDGSTVASVGGDLSMIFWDVASGEPLATVKNAITNWSMSRLAISPDGSTLSLTGNTSDGQVTIYDMNSYEALRSFNTGLRAAFRTTFLPDNRHLLVAGSDGPMRLYDLRYGTELERHTVNLPEEFTTAAAYSWTAHAESGQILYTRALPAGFTDIGEQPAYFLRYDRRNSTTDLYQMEDMADARNSAFIDSEQAITAFEDGTLIIWNVNSGDEIRRLQAPQGTMDIHGVYGRQILLMLPYDRSAPGEPAYLLDLDSGASQAFQREDHIIIDTHLTPDGRYVLTSSETGGVIVWDTADGSIVREQGGHRGLTIIGDIDARGERALSYSAGEMMIWDIESGDILQRFLTGPTDQLHVAWFTSQGVLFNGDTVRLFDINTGAVKRTFASPIPVHVTTLSDDERVLVREKENNPAEDTFVLWRLDNSSQLLQWTEGNRYIRDLSCEERALYQVGALCDATPAANVAVLP